MEQYRDDFANNLKYYMGKFNLNQKELADRIGVNKSLITLWIQGKNYPSMTTIEKIAEVFQIDRSDLIAPPESRSQVKGVRIPILGRIPAGIPLEAITEIDGWEEIPVHLAATGKFYGLRIEGNSMTPQLNPGDVVIIKKQDDIESGQVGIVLIGTEATIKQVKKTPDGIILIGFNVSVYSPHFYSNSDIETLPIRILGRVVESRHTW